MNVCIAYLICPATARLPEILRAGLFPLGCSLGQALLPLLFVANVTLLQSEQDA